MLWQVREVGMAAGEESALRQRLRQMEARQSSVQRCSVVATTQASLQEGLRAVQTQLNAILAEEQAQTDALAGQFLILSHPAHALMSRPNKHASCSALW